MSTFDDWASISRDLFNADGSMTPGSALFFVSFLIIVSFTLLPVVIAVLLDNFTTATRREKDKNEREKLERERGEGTTTSIDPLLQTFVNVKSDDEMKKRCSDLFDRLDVDRSGALSWQELYEGLKKMEFKPRINFSQDEYNAITLQHTLCDADGELDKEAFEKTLRIQMLSFAERNLANSLPAVMRDDQHFGFVMFALKLAVGDITKRTLGDDVSKRTREEEQQQSSSMSHVEDSKTSRGGDESKVSSRSKVSADLTACRK